MNLRMIDRRKPSHKANHIGLTLLGFALLWQWGKVCPPPPPLDPPEFVTVQTVSDQTMRVNWSEVTGAGFYKVYRNTAGGQPTLAADNVTTFSVEDGPGLNGGTLYFYRVKACAVPDIESTFSQAVSGYTLPTTPAPNAIETLSNVSLKLTWPACRGANRYEIYRNTSPETSATFTLAGLVYAPFFEDTLGLTEATHTWYKVRALGFMGISAYSAVVDGWTAPNPPTGVAAAPDMTTTTAAMVVTWTDRSLKEDGFVIERSATGSAPWLTFYRNSPSPGAGETVTWRDDQNIEEGKKYWYRVRAKLDQ